MPAYTDSEVSFLSSLNAALRERPSSQREIARRMDVSAGLVNIMVSRLLQKGLVAGEKADGKRMRYSLTAEGEARVAEYDRGQMRERFRRMREYGSSIARHLGQARFDGATRVVLYGSSELKFLIEYACRLYGMEFEEVPCPAAGGAPAGGGAGTAAGADGGSGAAAVFGIPGGIPAGTYAVLGDDVPAGDGMQDARNVCSVYELVG